MDKRKNKDWTGSVRDRLEKREVKPSDALWERIGEALPQAAEPRKVRRLPWSAGIGAAAAAALAAVLLLRPSGAPEPGRVDVIPPTASSPVAMVEKNENRPELTPDTHSERSEESITEENRSFATLRMTKEEALRITKEEVSKAVEEVNAEVKEDVNTEAREDMKAATAEIIEATDERTVKTEERNPATGAKTAMAGTGKTAVTNGTETMSIEEYIEMEQAAKRRHLSLTAAVYATGMPSKAGEYNHYADRIYSLVSSSKQPYSDYTPGSALPDAIGDSATASNSPGADYENSGYTSNPESQHGFEPVKYTEDPYNINGIRMNHSRPVSAGLALTMPLGRHLFAESGVYWSWLRSTSAMISDQSFHSVGIPLKLGYGFGGQRRISFSLSAGAKAEKVVYAVRGGTRVKEPGIQLAAVGDAAVQFDITRNLGIFLAPELSYWFTKTNLPTYNTEHPFNLSLKAGLNLTLGKN